MLVPCQIRHQRLALLVLVFALLEAPQFGYSHARELALPTVKRLFGTPRFAAGVRHGRAALDGAQCGDNLLLGKRLFQDPMPPEGRFGNCPLLTFLMNQNLGNESDRRRLTLSLVLNKGADHHRSLSPSFYVVPMTKLSLVVATDIYFPLGTLKD